MKDGPGIALVAALAGDPARANMLAALMDGGALTASELAGEAGVTPQTASSHLAKLAGGGLVSVLAQGRHRYFRLAGSDVAEMLEAMMGVASRSGQTRVRPGPRDPALRKARVCYDHLAGEMGVAMLDSLTASGCIAPAGLTRRGEAFARSFGIEVDALARQRRPLCRTCLDWSMRRHHLSGSFGAAMLESIFARKWARRLLGSRAIVFTPEGEARFARQFPR